MTKCLVCDIEEDSLDSVLRGQQFDVIVCADVLEHLRTPRDVLLRIKPFLRPTGYLVVSVPNVTHASVIYELIHSRFDYRQRGSWTIPSAFLLSVESVFAARGVRLRCRRVASDSEIAYRHGVQDQAARRGGGATFPDDLQPQPRRQTYQFVVKAYPALSSERAEGGLLVFQERVRNLENDLDPGRRVAPATQHPGVDGDPPHRPARRLIRRVLGLEHQEFMIHDVESKTGEARPASVSVAKADPGRQCSTASQPTCV